MRAVFSSQVDCCQFSAVSFLHLSLTIAWVITTSRWARKLDHSKKEGGGNHASATQSSRAGWRYREGNSFFSGPTPQSLGVCAAFFCYQARSKWDSVTSATQFHCPKLYTVHVPCAHAPGAGRSDERFFSLCDGVHDVSTAEPFWKTCCQKSGSIPFSIQPLWEVVNAYVACNPGLPLKEAKRKADDAWRETGTLWENEEEVEMMLSAEASLEEKDKRPAGSSFVVDKRGLEERRHRLLSENVR